MRYSKQYRPRRARATAAHTARPPLSSSPPLPQALRRRRGRRSDGAAGAAAGRARGRRGRGRAHRQSGGRRERAVHDTTCVCVCVVVEREWRGVWRRRRRGDSRLESVGGEGHRSPALATALSLSPLSTDHETHRAARLDRRPRVTSLKCCECGERGEEVRRAREAEERAGRQRRHGATKHGSLARRERGCAHTRAGEVTALIARVHTPGHVHEVVGTETKERGECAGVHAPAGFWSEAVK